MADTNAFNPAGFYGVAFEHLPFDAALAAVETADVFAASAGIIATASFAVTEPVDTLAGSALVAHMLALVSVEDTDTLAAALAAATESYLAAVEAKDILATTLEIVAFADFAISEQPDVVVVDVSSITHAALAVTEDFVDTATGDALVAHLPSFDLVETADAFDMELATTANVDMEVTEAPDQLSVDLFAYTEASMELVEDIDVLTATAGRWEFWYADSEMIFVAWEEQKVVVPGRPRGGEITFHPFITAFNEQAFYNNAFFTGSGAFHYSDDEAIRVPAPAVTERLREVRQSYARPRQRFPIKASQRPALPPSTPTIQGTFEQEVYEADTFFTDKVSSQVRIDERFS